MVEKKPPAKDSEYWDNYFKAGLSWKQRFITFAIMFPIMFAYMWWSVFV